jgi:hypothetical protein
LIEQDHRRIKQRLRSMLGLKSFQTADIVIRGIELAEKIKKEQFKMALRANIAETLSPALITEQGENGYQRELSVEEWCFSGPHDFARHGT